MNETDSVIRPAVFGDSEAIFELIRSYPHELLQRSISDIVQNIDRFIVCESKGKIVGTVAWQILPEIGAPREPSVEIKSLAVRKNHHKAGMGRALVQGAIDRLRPLDPAKIIALTFAPGFFRKMGFRTVAKRRLMHKIYMGCINCPKYDNPFTCPETAMALSLRPKAKP